MVHAFALEPLWLGLFSDPEGRHDSPAPATIAQSFEPVILCGGCRPSAPFPHLTCSSLVHPYVLSTLS